MVPSSHVINQHDLIVLDMWRGKTTKAKVTRKGRFRTWKLKKTNKKEDFKTMMKDKFQCRSEGLGVDVGRNETGSSGGSGGDHRENYTRKEDPERRVVVV